MSNPDRLVVVLCPTYVANTRGNNHWDKRSTRSNQINPRSIHYSGSEC
jgi:hypothetical protein